MVPARDLHVRHRLRQRRPRRRRRCEGDGDDAVRHGLGGPAWELKLTPVQQEHANGSYTDQLRFKGGQVISTAMLSKGFTSFDYTIEEQTHGKRVWQTVQTNPDGTTVRWYGIISGDQMRGVLTEIPACRPPAGEAGTGRDQPLADAHYINVQGWIPLPKYARRGYRPHRPAGPARFLPYCAELSSPGAGSRLELFFP